MRFERYRGECIDLTRARGSRHLQTRWRQPVHSAGGQEVADTTSRPAAVSTLWHVRASPGARAPRLGQADRQGHQPRRRALGRLGRRPDHPAARGAVRRMGPGAADCTLRRRLFRVQAKVDRGKRGRAFRAVPDRQHQSQRDPARNAGIIGLLHGSVFASTCVSRSAKRMCWLCIARSS